MSISGLAIRLRCPLAEIPPVPRRAALPPPRRGGVPAQRADQVTRMLGHRVVLARRRRGDSPVEIEITPAQDGREVALDWLEQVVAERGVHAGEQRPVQPGAFV